MSSILLSPPAIEPLTLAEAKLFLRVESGDDDDVISALIAAARMQIEAQTRRALIAQTWRASRDCWPAGGVIAVLPAPLRALAAARVYRLDGTAQTIDNAAFVLDKISAPGRLLFMQGALPAPGRPAGGIELDIEVGYGSAAADVPAPLRQAIRLLVAHWYENRGLVTTGPNFSPLPAGVASLIAPYGVLSL